MVAGGPLLQTGAPKGSKHLTGHCPSGAEVHNLHLEEKNTNAKNRIAGLLMFVKLAADTLPKPTLLIVQLLCMDFSHRQ